MTNTQTSTRKAEINKEILKSIGKRGGSSIDYNDVEEYLRNRYYDTSRQFTPLSFQPIERPEVVSRNAKMQTNFVVPDQSTKQSDKNAPAMNETNQEQVYVIDDMRNNINDDDDDSQIKYIYSLYKNRLSNDV